MSANNWAVCPQCTHRLAIEVEKAQGELDAAYGKVTLAEFDALRADVDAKRALLASPTERVTFREDYEIYGADEALIGVDYRGSCKTCGLQVSFKHFHGFEVKP